MATITETTCPYVSPDGRPCVLARGHTEDHQAVDGTTWPSAQGWDRTGGRGMGSVTEWPWLAGLLGQRITLTYAVLQPTTGAPFTITGRLRLIEHAGPQILGVVLVPTAGEARYLPWLGVVMVERAA